MASAVEAGDSNVMRLSVRRPDGGQATIPVRKTDSVDTLRAMIKWCTDHNDWDQNAIPRDIRQRKGKGKNRVNDEMWTLNEQVEAPGGAETDPDEHEDLEAVHYRSNPLERAVIENTEPGRIEIMHGPIILQDGYLLSEYAVEDGSFLHPLYTLRGKLGEQSMSFGLLHLPWKDREWYRAGTSSALASVSSWWSDAAETFTAAAAGSSLLPESSSAYTQGPPGTVPDEQFPDIFGNTLVADNNAL